MGVGTHSPYHLLTPQPQYFLQLGAPARLRPPCPSAMHEIYHQTILCSHSLDSVSEAAIFLGHKKLKTVITMKLNQVHSKSSVK